jgi:HTH-type transcriptional regulator, sugar sensing transcriptional regulator
MEDAYGPLQDLGLNRLEAEVYVFLLSNRPSTAYGIGKRLGRPTANVYSAVEALSRRGAVLIEDGESRLCRAVPAAEFLNRLDREFHDRTKDTAQLLSRIETPSDDERVYRLESAPQLFERCRQMLDDCQRFLVIDAFPRALAAILPSVKAAVRRGATVYVEAYEPVTIEGAHVAVAADVGSQVLAQWRSEQLNVIVDGRESITALLNTELTEVYQGLWTNSRYFSCLMHSGRLAEHTLLRLHNAVFADPTGEGLAAILAEHPFLLLTDVPGQAEILARYTKEIERHFSCKNDTQQPDF